MGRAGGRAQRLPRHDAARAQAVARTAADQQLVFGRPDGLPWRDTDYRNWRRRTFAPAAGPGLRPYDLRHSFVSLLIHEGQSIVEVARQAGHSPTMCLDTYAHVLEEFDPNSRISAEERIRMCRQGVTHPAAAQGPR